MRRHRMLVLVPAMLLSAACTRRDDATENPLDRDLTLSAQLQKGQADSSAIADLSKGGVCTKEPTPATPTASQRAQAAALEQRAAEAEFVGNIQVARVLHRQAARLDGTSEEIAYRLGRADEAVGDKSQAVREYCRYLALAPSAANAKEVRTRLMALASATPAQPQQVAVQSQPMQQGASVRSNAGSQRAVTSVRTTGRAAGARVATAAPTNTGGAAAANAPQTAGQGGAAAPSSSVAPVEPQAVYGSAAGEVAAAEGQQDSAPQTLPAPAPSESRPTPSPRRSTDHTLRNATIGAVAGAAVGGMTSRSAKGAVVGGVAGGILGAVLGRANYGPNSGFRTPGWAH